MTPFNMAQIRCERTFKSRDSVYRRVVSHDKEPAWFRLVDGDWVLMTYAPSDEMEWAFRKWHDSQKLSNQIS